jgi:hypothetical protein
VASGCLQTGVNLSDLVLAEPGNQVMPAIGRIGEALGALTLRDKRMVIKRFTTAPPARKTAASANIPS